MDILRCFPILSASLLFSVSVYSDGSLHEPPFDYWFGNHMDTHQQTRLNEEGSLFGFLYVIDTGEVDADSGLPIMYHPRGLGETYDERCGVSVKCIKGWQLRGQPGHAKFLFHSGVNGHDHPVWLVNRVDILQPGHYSHFHWITRSATDQRAGLVSEACDKVMAGQLETQEPHAINESCQGWFLQLTALRAFAFEHGGEVMPVYPGNDNATHMNLLGNYQAVEGITATRGGVEH